MCDFLSIFWLKIHTFYLFSSLILMLCKNPNDSIYCKPIQYSQDTNNTLLYYIGVSILNNYYLQYIVFTNILRLIKVILKIVGAKHKDNLCCMEIVCYLFLWFDHNMLVRPYYPYSNCKSILLFFNGHSQFWRNLYIFIVFPCTASINK